MKRLKRSIRKSGQTGSTVYGNVLEVNLGKATVKVGDSLLSNLPIVGGSLVAGNTCIVDYTSESPVARPLTVPLEPTQPTIPVAERLRSEVIQPIEELETTEYYVWDGGDHSVQVYQYGGSPTSVPLNTWTAVSMTNTAYDTDTFWNAGAPTVIKPLAPGYYLFTAEIGYQGINAGMTEKHGEIRIDSSTQGTVVYNKFSLLRRSSSSKVDQAIGLVKTKAGEQYTLYVNQTGTSSMTLPQLQGVYPRLTAQWIGNYPLTESWYV